MSKIETNKAWIECFWKNKEDIQNDARVYDNVKWYKAPRYLASIIMIMQLLAGFVTGLLNIGDLFAATAVFGPLIYLVARGYRPFIAITIILYTIDKLYTMYIMEYLSISAFCWWIVTIYFLIMAYRVEQERVSLHIDVQKKYLRDTTIFVLIFGIFFISAAIFPKPEPGKELMYWKGFVYRNTDGVNKYCAGTDMVTYNQKFTQKNQNSINYVNDKITDMGFNPQTLFNDVKIPPEIIDGQVAYYFETLRKGLISFVAIGQSGAAPEAFVWKDEFWDIMPRPEFCKFINNNFELFESMDSDFAKFNQLTNN